ncbi:MAG: hypothetical protein JWQ27_2828 [Ferruginibacter sp.]|nr:hypothetical protein [Ferruginibacter sp.]
MRSKLYSIKVCSLLIILLSFFSINKSSAQQYLTTIDGWNAYVHLPDDYNDGTLKRYPLICFVPGLGEVGTDPTKMLVYGPSKYVAEGHNMQFMVNGRIEKPIVISIQPLSAWPGAATINRKMDSIFNRFRCDLQRINVTGLSMGGWTWDNFVDGYNPVYTNKITSIVSLSAPEPDNTVANMRQFAEAGGKFWAFEGNQDLRGNDKIRDTMNKYVLGSARYTLFSGGHCCWNTFYNPTYTENGESVYTWMLKQKKPMAPAAPQADAGNDSSIAVVVPAVPLKGWGNDPNGLPINFAWRKISGPAAGTISNPGTSQTTISGLTSGIYRIELAVTNFLGSVAKDTILINNGNLVLPLTLTDFTAKASKQSVVLQWKTANEINSSYFIIERSNNGTQFNSEGNVQATALPGQGANYNFTDATPEAGINYYRLKIVDKDGRFEYSKVVNANIADIKNSSAEILTVHAATSTIEVQINSNKAQQISLLVSDVSGRKLLVTSLNLQKGLNRISQSLNLVRGMYITRMITASEEFTSLPFIKQ